MLFHDEGLGFTERSNAMAFYAEAEQFLGWCLDGQIVYGFTSGSCAANQFDCGDGTCISNLLLYDCFPDCADGIDEECWPGMVKCDKCKCVNKNDLALKCSEGHCAFKPARCFR
uniref:Uncharacterized protein n=1 Tax=Romanomermis culicivorax TaxID=13658 RepID=A0A915KTF1_ROMCU